MLLCVTPVNIYKCMHAVIQQRRQQAKTLPSIHPLKKSAKNATFHRCNLRNADHRVRVTVCEVGTNKRGGGEADRTVLFMCP